MIGAFLATLALACPTPHAAPWRMHPDGCATLRPGGSLTLPRAATEVDIWSADGRVHLRQTRDRYPGDAACPQWAFGGRGGYAAGWVTCNRDVFGYGRRALRVYWWEG